jgi:hypothetical protein
MAAIVCCLNLSAQDTLKIMFLEPSPVIIGGREYRKGDLFLSSEKPDWLPKQVMSVFNVATGKTQTLTEVLMEMSGNKTIWAYLTDSKRLSTREGKLLNNVELSAFFNRTIGMLERISVDAYLPVDSSRFYYVNYEYNGENINKKLPVNDNLIVIDRSIFIIDGVRKEPFNTKLKLYYYNAETEHIRLLADSLTLNIISARKCRSFIDNYPYIKLENNDIKELIAEYLTFEYPSVFFQMHDIELFITELILNSEK